MSGLRQRLREETMKNICLTLVLLAMLILAAPVRAEGGRTDIHEQAEQVQPLLPGMQAPAFSLKDAAGNPVAFDPAGMSKPLVLTFFRGGWCPYCNLHLSEMRKAEAELREMDFDIWFISIDRPEMLYASLDDPDLPYRVLSDSKLEATRAFGLAFRVSDELVKKYLTWDIDLEGASGENHHVLPAPSTYIIGSDGKIRFQYTNPEYNVRLHPDVLLAAARAYKNGEDERLKREYSARKNQ